MSFPERRTVICLSQGLFVFNHININFNITSRYIPSQATIFKSTNGGEIYGTFIELGLEQQ